jgi:hypothetical protein
MPIRAALWFFLPLIFTCDVTFPDAGAAKMTIQELLARHLDSIGTPEARAAAKNVVGSGTSQVVFRIPGTGQLSGTGSVLSEGRMIRIEMVFAAQDYQSERLVFNGNNVDVGQIQILERSMLSDFVYHYGMGMLKEGLIGGAMTTAWAMLDVPGRQPKLDYSGLKKVGGKNMHELRYRPKKDPGDLQITLYFDPETFRHLYSQYRMVIRGGVGQRTRPTLADPGGTAPDDSFFKLEEWFEDFKTVDGLTSPHKYRIRFNREGPNPFLCEYGITLTRVLHNQTIDPKSFIIAK